MRRVFTVVLVLAMLLPVVCAMGGAAEAADYTSKPFYGSGWSDINRIKFPNLEGLTIVSVRNLGDGQLGLSYAGKTDPKEIAASVKKIMDRNPEGLRNLFLSGTANAFSIAPEDAIFMENGVGQLKALFTELITEYKALGGQLDSLVLDTEYVYMGSWYLYSKFYGPLYTPTDPTIYKDIVENPKYATLIRPLLVERGFVFYDNPSGNKAEITSAFPYQYLSYFLGTKDIAKYANCAAIWNTVMGEHMARYLNDALLAPLAACYPDAIMSDYQEDEMDAWQKSLSDTGEIRGSSGGNGIAVGNASNYNTYASRPSSSFFVDKDGNYLYRNLPAFNNAVYEDDPYHMFLYDANKFKQMYASTDNKQITAWIAEYDYSTSAGSVSNTPYYTETLYHLGMLDPETFLIYIWSGDSKFKGENGTAEYNKRMQTISEILNELTRVAGYSDRKPIETPINWNDGFVLSGMYAGGRNIWRITPDTTEGTTLESFVAPGDVPTFSINGTTVVFPQGRIVFDSDISVVGSAGYWVETPEGVTPVITRDADRYAKNPSYAEAFDYADGTVFNGQNANEKQAWETSGDPVVQGGALMLNGTATVNNVKLPKNITAGDSYARQQAWEVSFTLSSALNSGAAVKLLTCGADGGVKLEGNKLYYDQNGRYKELSGVTLSAGQKYTVKRELAFSVGNDDSTCSYSIYRGNELIKKVENIPMARVELPVSSIGFACYDLTTVVSLDDYKLYPTGLAQDFEVYNAESGVRLDAAAKNSAQSVAYRLSWLNGSKAGVKVNIKAALYDSAGALISEKVIRTVELAPGCDGVETGIVENAGDKVLVYLENAGAYTPDEQPDYDDDFEWGSEPTLPPATYPTVSPDLPEEPEETLPEAPPSQPAETEPSVAATVAPATQTTAGSGQTAATKPTTGNQSAATKATAGNQGDATKATQKPIQGIVITRPTQGSSGESAPAWDYEDPSAAPTEELEEPSVIPTGAHSEPTATPTEGNTQTDAPTEPSSSGNITNATAPGAAQTPDVEVEEPQIKNGLNAGDIALIAAGALVAAGGAAAGIIFYLKKKKAAKSKD